MPRWTIRKITPYRLLREIREQVRTIDRKIDRNQVELKDSIEGLRRFTAGESVLGRYAAGEVDERLDALERRISALEERR